MFLIASWVTCRTHLFRCHIIWQNMFNFNNNNNNNWTIYTVQIIVWNDYCKWIHAHTYSQAPAHSSMLTIHNLIYNQLKQITNRNLRQRKIAEQSRKYGRFIVLEKEMSWDWVWCYLLSTYHSNCTLDMHGVYWLRSVFCDFCSTFLCSHMFTGQVDVMSLFLTNRCVRDMTWKPGGTAHIS